MIDWDDPMWQHVPEGIRVHLPKRSEEYALRILKSYSPQPELVPEPEPVKVKTKRGINLSQHRHVQFTYDYKEIAALFEQGLLVKEIAEKLSCSPTTVRSALQKTKPAGYTGKSGRRPKTHCINGHEMAVHGRPATNGGRYCSECKRIRERVRPDRDQAR